MTKHNRGKSRRERLFDDYSTNLQFYRPNSKGLFICPLCFKSFDHRALDNGDLAIEHIIPSSMGGRLETLTCKNCNNQSGANLEGHLKRQVEMDDIFKGNRREPVRVKVAVGEGEQTADVYLFDEDGSFSLQILGKPELSNPTQLAKVIEALENNPREFDLQFNLGYKELPAKVAKIRIAYLLMFRQFGYGYIPNPYLDVVRELINAPTADSAPLSGLFNLREHDTPTGVGLLTKPESLRGFAGFVNLPTTTSLRFCVLFPGFDQFSGDLYDRLRGKIQEGAKQEEMAVTIFEYDPRHLTSPEYVGLPHRIWQTLLNHP